MITQVKLTKPQQTNPTSAEPINSKQATIRKCQQITKLIQSKIQTQITNGQVKVRQKPLHIQLNQQQDPVAENPEKSIRDKIVSLNQELEMLQKHIADQKEQDRINQERKKKQAALLIERLKREKEQYRNKLKLNEMSNRLKNSVLSEDVIKLMKERRMSLVQERQKDMELRIYKNLNRRAEREDDQAKNEISYWTKVKQIEDRKRYQSNKVLPSIQKVNEQPQFGVNLGSFQRKNSHKIIMNFAHKRSFSKQDVTADYHEIVNKFLQRAKAKQAQSKSQNTPHLYDKSRLITHDAISQKNQSQLAHSRLSQMKNEKIQKIVGSYIQNKRKLLGNQYLKQSLLRVDRSKSPRGSRLQDSSVLQQSLELKGNPAIFSRNDKLTNYQQRREKILQNLLNLKLEKSRAIQMLHPIESMLDRIHPQGIQIRLRQKLDIFENYHRKIEQIQSGKTKQHEKIEEYSENSEQVI